MAELQDVFLTFCSFGDRKGGGAMDGAKFAKLCRDTKIQGKRVSSTEVDITFSKVMPARAVWHSVCCVVASLMSANTTYVVARVFAIR